MTKLRWQGTWGADAKKQLRPLFLRFKKVVPSWCRILFVSVTNSEEWEPQKLAETASLWEYEQAHIVVHEKILLEPVWIHEHVVRHEIAHLFVAPFSAAVEWLLPADKTEVLETTLTKMEEVTTCAIAELLRGIQ